MMSDKERFCDGDQAIEMITFRFEDNKERDLPPDEDLVAMALLAAGSENN